MNKGEILKVFELFSLSTDGIGGWLGSSSDDRVFEHLGRIDPEPLAKDQLNQLARSPSCLDEGIGGSPDSAS